MKQFIASLAVVIVSAVSLSAQTATTAQSSPKAIMAQFLVMAAGGDLQTSDGWKKASVLFAHSSQLPNAGPLVIMGEDYAVQELWARGTHAEVVVTYRSLGTIDSSLRYSYQRIAKAERRYQLVRGGGSSNAGWRIQNPSGVLLIGSNAAIDYVTRMRDSANNPTLKKNAEATLQKVKALH